MKTESIKYSISTRIMKKPKKFLNLSRKKNRETFWESKKDSLIISCSNKLREGRPVKIRGQEIIILRKAVIVKIVK